MILKFNNYLSEGTRNKVTFTEAAQIALKANRNTPMTAREIWDYILDNKIASSNGVTPWITLNTVMSRFSKNTNIDLSKQNRNPNKIEIFEIVGSSPQKFKLINPNEVQNIDEESEEYEEHEQSIVNPFKQAICILGESGSGKSHTIETILDNEGHEFEFIIPTAATTGLLAQFSPTKSGYVPSRLGKMIINAAKNPTKLYTAVFDEMHKSNVIEMINDELLQAISIHRNAGVRFISLDDDTAELYNIPELEKKRGNIILPDNFGFIFISSKPRVIANNPDFFNRVDIVRLKHFEEESVESSDNLISLILDDDEKNHLVSRRED